MFDPIASFGLNRGSVKGDKWENVTEYQNPLIDWKFLLINKPI